MSSRAGLPAGSGCAVVVTWCPAQTLLAPGETPVDDKTILFVNHVDMNLILLTGARIEIMHCRTKQGSDQDHALPDETGVWACSKRVPAR